MRLLALVLACALPAAAANVARPLSPAVSRAAGVDVARYPALSPSAAPGVHAARVDDLLRLAVDFAADASVLSGVVDDLAAMKEASEDPALAQRIGAAHETIRASLESLRQGRAEYIARRSRVLAEELGLPREIDAPAAGEAPAPAKLAPAEKRAPVFETVMPRPLTAEQEAHTPHAQRGMVKVLVVGAGAGVAIAAAKFVAAGVSGSSAMMAEGIHSLVDTLNKLFLWFGMSFSKKAPTARHPYGFAREAYFWTLVVALLVFFLGSIFSIYHGVEKILHPEPLVGVGTTFAVLAFSLAVEIYAAWVGIKEYRSHFGDKPFLKTARESKDLAIIATIIEDVLAGLGVVVAIIGLGLAVLLNLPIIDGITSVLIGLILGGAALFLAQETKGLIIGEGASPADIVRIKSAVVSVPRVLEIVELDTEHRGPNELFVTMKLHFAAHLTVHELEKTVLEVERAIQDAVPSARHIYIEAGSFKPS